MSGSTRKRTGAVHKMQDRRKKLRRNRDKELEAKMLVVENILQSHLVECSENAKAVRNELASMNQRFDTYHAQNQAVSHEQRDMLAALVAAKRISIGAGRAIKWLVSLLAAAAGALGLYTFFKTP